MTWKGVKSGQFVSDKPMRLDFRVEEGQDWRWVILVLSWLDVTVVEPVCVQLVIIYCWFYCRFYCCPPCNCELEFLVVKFSKCQKHFRSKILPRIWSFPFFFLNSVSIAVYKLKLFWYILTRYLSGCSVQFLIS